MTSRSEAATRSLKIVEYRYWKLQLTIGIGFYATCPLSHLHAHTHSSSTPAHRTGPRTQTAHPPAITTRFSTSARPAVPVNHCFTGFTGSPGQTCSRFTRFSGMLSAASQIVKASYVRLMGSFILNNNNNNSS